MYFMNLSVSNIMSCLIEPLICIEHYSHLEFFFCTFLGIVGLVTNKGKVVIWGFVW